MTCPACGHNEPHTTKVGVCAFDDCDCDETPPVQVAARNRTRRLVESVYYPDHDPRKASAEYGRVHQHLVYDLDEPCWICGVRQSQLPDGEHNETHHWTVEWALANSIDPAKILAQFPTMGAADEEHLRDWLDSEGNMLVLCARCHRHGLYGIHSTTYPAWVAQKYQQDGWDLVNGPAK
jgi:hypothetical protein